MSISSINSSSYTNPFTTVKKDFSALASALKSGSLTDARQAYSTLKTDTSSQSSDSNNPMAKDLAGLGSSLDSGDLAAAQQKFAEIQKHMKGHGEFARQQVALQTTDVSQTQDQDSSDGGNDPLGKDFQSLSRALQSSNVSDAQKALTTLQKDAASVHGGSSLGDPFSKDLSSLGDALQSGDLSGAQQQFAQIQQKMSRPPLGPPPGPPPVDAQNRSTTGNTIDSDLETLSSALQSGNTDDAQKAFAALQKDLTSQESGSARGTGSVHGHHHHSSTAAAGTGSATASSTDTAATTASSSTSSDASGTSSVKLTDYLKQAIESYVQASNASQSSSSSLLSTANYL